MSEQFIEWGTPTQFYDTAMRMCDEKGNRAVAAMLHRLAASILEGKIRRGELPEILNMERHRLGRRYREVWDSEPEWAILHVVNAICAHEGWVPFDKWDLFPAEDRHG